MWNHLANSSNFDFVGFGDNRSQCAFKSAAAYYSTKHFLKKKQLYFLFALSLLIAKMLANWSRYLCRLNLFTPALPIHGFAMSYFCIHCKNFFLLIWCGQFGFFNMLHQRWLHIGFFSSRLSGFWVKKSIVCCSQTFWNSLFWTEIGESIQNAQKHRQKREIKRNDPI